MLLVADSGSTKTQWKCAHHPIIETIGFNPFFYSSEQILAELEKSTELSAIKLQITEVYFYGAACSSPERKAVIADALNPFFKNATLKVGHDLEAAAYATYTDTPTISCIIGTGSNSCLFDGDSLIEVVPSLGYILGDEGSGGYFGKKLLADFLYHQSPTATATLLAEKYALTKEIIFENIYKKPNANVYLASFARVLSESPDTDYISKIVGDGFAHFIEQHVCCYSDFRNYPVSFVGSMAFHFQSIITQNLHERGCQVGHIIQSPIDRLFEWHLAKD